MGLRFAKPIVALVLIAGLWALSQTRRDRARGWVHTGTAAKPVKILRFYSTTAYLMAGDTAKLCYSVENARLVRIVPMMGKVLPSTNRCLEVVPQRTTHYTILAEGFDGQVVMQSLTLAVDTPHPVMEPTYYAGRRGITPAGYSGKGGPGSAGGVGSSPATVAIVSLRSRPSSRS